MNDSEPDKTVCRVCKESIEIGAKKCIHCDSYQDWRRYLGVSSSMITLLIALISVSALSAKHIQELFVSDHSNVDALIARVSPEGILILAGNTGNKSGAILGGTLEIRGSQKSASRELWPNGSIIVEAGKPKEMLLIFSEPPPSSQQIQAMRSPTVDYLYCGLELNILQYQAMDRTFQELARDRIAFRKEQESRRSEDQAIVVRSHSTPSSDKNFLNFECRDIIDF